MKENGIVAAKGGFKRALAIRLKPGTDVLRGLEKACQEAGIQNGVIVSALGSLSRVAFCNAVEIPESKVGVGYSDPEIMPGPMEMLAASGVVCHDLDGTVNLHVHMCASGEDGIAHGGHLAEGTTVLVTLDVVIAELDGIQMERILDPDLDLPILTPREG